jgi:hypothetical protein
MRIVLALGFVLAVAVTVRPCTFCAGSFANRQTLRERAATSAVVVHGTLTASRVGPDGLRGETDFAAMAHLKADAKLGTPTALTIPQYLPLVGDTPREYLVFGTVVDGKLDITGGLTWPTAAAAYAKDVLALPGDSPTRLAFFFRHLDSAEAVVAADAFLEFAKASDAEIAAAAKSFDAAKVRRWLADPTTPRERIGVYALLLGLTGGRDDADRFATMLDATDERTTSNLGGLVAGLTLLDADRGWNRIAAIAADGKQPYDRRLAMLNAMRYFAASRPKESKAPLLAIAARLIPDADVADAIVEDLRQWQWWDHTDAVLAAFDRPTHRAPIVRQAIVRYAMQCPDDRAKSFVAKIRLAEPKLVERVEEGLKRLTK